MPSSPCWSLLNGYGELGGGCPTPSPTTVGQLMATGGWIAGALVALFPTWTVSGSRQLSKSRCRETCDLARDGRECHDFSRDCRECRDFSRDCREARDSARDDHEAPDSARDCREARDWSRDLAGHLHSLRDHDPPPHLLPTHRPFHPPSPCSPRPSPPDLSFWLHAGRSSCPLPQSMYCLFCEHSQLL